MLYIERQQNGQVEEGKIYFFEGQPTYASCWQMSGQEAFVWLLTWRHISFSFGYNDARPVDNIRVKMSEQRYMNTHNAANNVATHAIHTIQTTQAAPTARRTSEPLGAFSIPVDAYATVQQTSSSPVTQPISYYYEQEDDQPQIPFFDETTQPNIESLIPRKQPTEVNVLALPLTRPQRSIYMMIDGKRNIADLSRCLRKSYQEIERSLRELQQQNLVAM